ncbi:MAG: DUF2239 family protein, partial [Comamonas sp.]
PATYTVFNAHQHITTGSLPSAALAFKQQLDESAAGPVLLFNDATGRSMDVDIRGTDQEVLARLPVTEATASSETSEPTEPTPETTRGRGRPKLGVVAREVTLLPRHWEWLATQSGGASVALRKLVEDARRAHSEKDWLRNAQERTYHFMSAIGGDLPGFEEASRALFAKDNEKLKELLAVWPEGVRHHTIRLLFGDV